MNDEANTQNTGPAKNDPAGTPVAAESDEELLAARWRRAILSLSSKFRDAAGERSDLSPILLEAMHNALNNLLIYGEAGDLMALEEWLSVEDDLAPVAETASRPLSSRAGDRRDIERRVNVVRVTSERRRPSERRSEDRRAISDWQFEAMPNSTGSAAATS